MGDSAEWSEIGWEIVKTLHVCMCPDCSQKKNKQDTNNNLSSQKKKKVTWVIKPGSQINISTGFVH